MKIEYILLIVYVVSFAINYIWTRIAHSKNGYFEDEDIDLFEFATTVLPVLNTIFGLVRLCLSPYNLSSKEGVFFKWFFNIKK